MINKVDSRIDELSREILILNDIERYDRSGNTSRRLDNLAERLLSLYKFRIRLSRERAVRRLAFTNSFYRLPDDVRRLVASFR